MEYYDFVLPLLQVCHPITASYNYSSALSLLFFHVRRLEVEEKAVIPTVMKLILTVMEATESGD